MESAEGVLKVAAGLMNAIQMFLLVLVLAVAIVELMRA